MREDEFPENLHPAFKRLVYFLLEENPESESVLQQTLLGLQEGVSDTQLNAVKELAEAAGKHELSSQKEGYQEWLQQAAQGSLRPIYRSIKAHEAQVVRPFLDRPFELRPYLKILPVAKYLGQLRRLRRSGNSPAKAASNSGG